VTISWEDPELDFSTNTRGTPSTRLEAARLAKIPVAICSSISYLGADGNQIASPAPREATRYVRDPMAIGEDEPLLRGSVTPLHASKRRGRDLHAVLHRYLSIERRLLSSHWHLRPPSVWRLKDRQAGWANFAIHALLGSFTISARATDGGRNASETKAGGAQLKGIDVGLRVDLARRAWRRAAALPEPRSKGSSSPMAIGLGRSAWPLAQGGVDAVGSEGMNASSRWRRDLRQTRRFERVEGAARVGAEVQLRVFPGDGHGGLRGGGGRDSPQPAAIRVRVSLSRMSSTAISTPALVSSARFVMYRASRAYRDCGRTRASPCCRRLDHAGAMFCGSRAHT